MPRERDGKRRDVKRKGCQEKETSEEGGGGRKSRQGKRRSGKRRDKMQMARESGVTRQRRLTRCQEAGMPRKGDVRRMGWQKTGAEVKRWRCQEKEVSREKDVEGMGQQRKRCHKKNMPREGASRESCPNVQVRVKNAISPFFFSQLGWTHCVRGKILGPRWVPTSSNYLDAQSFQPTGFLCNFPEAASLMILYRMPSGFSQQIGRVQLQCATWRRKSFV